MLPALPVDKITASARGAAMAGAAKEEGGSSGGRSRRARGTAKKPGGRAGQSEQIAAEAAVDAVPAEASPGLATAAETVDGTVEGAVEGAVEPTVLPPVREGEDDWTLEELDDVRSRLADEVDELGADIASAESQIAQGDTADGAGDDQADLGTKTYTREHEMSLALNARELLVQNERAIHRIDAGTYGMCESCGNPIGKARLQAFPRATLCVRCKQREERR